MASSVACGCCADDPPPWDHLCHPCESLIGQKAILLKRMELVLKVWSGTLALAAEEPMFLALGPDESERAGKHYQDAVTAIVALHDEYHQGQRAEIHYQRSKAFDAQAGAHFDQPRNFLRRP